MEPTENKLKSFLTSPKGLTVIVVCVATLLATYLLLTTQINTGGSASKTPTITTSPTNTQTSAYPTTNPSQITSVLSFSQNADNSINVLLDTAGNNVSGVQLAISYTPSILTGVWITPGDFFVNPVTLQNSIDATHGAIYYTVSIQPNSAQQHGKGTIAILHYISLIKGSSASLSFLPQTKITTLGVNDSVLKRTTPMNLP